MRKPPVQQSTVNAYYRMVAERTWPAPTDPERLALALKERYSLRDLELLRAELFDIEASS